VKDTYRTIAGRSHICSPKYLNLAVINQLLIRVSRATLFTVTFQEVERRFLRSASRLSLINNVDFVGVLSWLDVDDGLGGSPTSSRDHDVVLIVDAGWLNKDHLLTTPALWKIEGMFLVHILRLS
jgi:hypothetical protein